MQHPDDVRRRLSFPIVAFVVALLLAVAGLTAFVRAAGIEPLARRALATKPSTPPSPRPSSPPVPAAPVPRATGPSVAPRPSSPSAQMAALAAALPRGSVSVAVRNLKTGARFTFGSSSGQVTASLVKVDILEALLLQLQTSDEVLTADEDSEATSMIEDSDDGSADHLWNDIGGGSALAAANKRLGVSCTAPGSGPYWGLTTTCAWGQVQLLYQLENHSSPLDKSKRAYILNLMENVSSDQAWGVPVVADAQTAFAVKDGWLNINGDTDWAVTSEGIVTYDGQTLLIAALTQNNDTVYTGIQLVQQLAQLAAQSVTA